MASKKIPGTVTGRMSSRNSNLAIQNSPTPKPDAGNEIRKAFVQETKFYETGSCKTVRSDIFTTFSKAVADRWQEITANTAVLYRSTVTKDQLWDTYLAAWPAGTNEIHLTRREHDCQTCRQFIRAVGGVVVIVDDKLQTIWDIGGLPEAYQTVADAMAKLVRSGGIDNYYLHTESTAGALKTRPLGSDITWNHFFVNLPSRVVVPGVDIGTKQADTRSTHDVLSRGLRELSMESIDTVLDLIKQNSLYRGEEQQGVLNIFKILKAQYDSLVAHVTTDGNEYEAAQQLDLFVWANIGGSGAVTRIRNTSIGTLLVDLSNGVELEPAVLAYEAKLNPLNYKRPTALVSKAQIERAQKAIEELGLTSALERRYAVSEDITTNNVLFVDRITKLKGSKAEEAFGVLATKAATPLKALGRVEEIGIEKFLSEVLPGATSLEVLFENKHTANLVSLIAPVDPTAQRLFKWDNNFSWTYAGDVTDSIRERVKKAGGAVTGDLCCRLAWDYSDDLDFHMVEPSGHEIYYANRRRLSGCGGVLDLDANGADGPVLKPAENIVYAQRRTMREGVYKLKVNNYARCSSGPTAKGFDVEVEFDGQLISISYDKVMKTGDTIEVAHIEYKAGVLRVVKSLPSTQTSKTLWNVSTQTFVKVNLAMYSPNHWEAPISRRELESNGGERPTGIGNRHYFFMLQGCKNEDTARGFYNEFLDARLDAHRRTLELVGAKMRTDESDRQLSGLGFSSTNSAQLTVRVKGTFERVLKVNI